MPSSTAAAPTRKHVRISLVRTARSLIVRIQDPARASPWTCCRTRPFPIRTCAHPARRGSHQAGTAPRRFRHPHDRNLVDELVYNQRGNEVLFVKYLPAGATATR